MKRIIYSYQTTIFLLILYSLLLAAATIAEKYLGTEFAKIFIYYSPVFILLHLFLIINFITAALYNKLLKKRNMGFLIIHLAFVIILFGAFTSYIVGEEGIIHIREGEKSNMMMVQQGKRMGHKTLPFSIELTEFILQRYPGSSRPSSFESQLVIHDNEGSYPKRISMNNVLDIKGYRLFQTSYDKDEKGTILTINKDVAGRNITYAGYALLLIGFIFSFVAKNSRFRQLNNRIKELRTYIPLFILSIMMVIPQSLAANTSQQSLANKIEGKVIPLQHASEFGALPMLSNTGRIEPINTFTSKLLRKLHKSEKIEGLNSDQFVLSVLTFPDIWMHIPFIHLSNPDIALYYDLSKDYCSYTEAFDVRGNYKLNEKLEEIVSKAPSERSTFDKDLLKLDEQLNIFHQLLNFNMLHIFPKENDPDNKWYAPGDDLSVFSGTDSLFVSSILPLYIQELREAMQTDDWSKPAEIVNMIKVYQQKRTHTVQVDASRIEAELLYNKLNLFKHCKKGYLITGGILLIFSFVSLLKRQKTIRILSYILTGIIILYFLAHLFGIGLRGYISGYAPWSNSYETMVFVAWITVLAGLCFIRKSMLIFALATLFAGVILFVSGLNWMDPQIDLLVPVLKSPWLMFHVATIVSAYGFFGVSCLIGLVNMITMLLNKSKEQPFIMFHLRKMTIINEMSILIGLALMTIGTFLGAIWANESWGRYWGWDPKETWALITIIVYVITTHIRLVRKWDNIWLFNLLSILSFYSVLMTYFGVNYFLSGMHSYGQTDSMNNFFIYIFGTIILIASIAIFSYKKIYIQNRLLQPV